MAESLKCYVYINDHVIETRKGENLRRVLMQNQRAPHNANPYISCQGLGSCGTCAVEVLKGDAGKVTFMERWRLRFPPHKQGPQPMRLACQITITEDLHLRKHTGFWGAFIDEDHHSL